MFLFAEVGQENIVASLLDWRSNIINWVLLVAILVYLIKKYVPTLLAQRQEEINNELALAKQTRQNAEEALAEQKKRLAQAGQEAERIIQEAKLTAQQMSEEMKRQTEIEIADLQKKFEQAVVNERQAAVFAMRTLVSQAAIKLTEENLKSILTPANKTKIANDFMGELSKFSSSNNGKESVNGGERMTRNPQKVGQA